MLTLFGRKMGTAALFVAAISIPMPAQAQSAFNATSGGVARQNLGLEGGRAEDIVIASNGSLYAALNSPNGIFCSTDGAVSWTAPPAGSNLGDVIAVAVGETDDTAYLIGGIQLYKTADGCRTFTELTLTNGAHSDFARALAYAGGTLLVAFRDGTVARSTDGGATLATVPVAAGVTSVNDLAASPTAGTFYAMVVDGSSPAVYQSIDGGGSWAPLGGSFSCPACSRVRVDPADGQHLIATGFGVVMRSNDGGASWHDVTPGYLGAITPTFAGSRVYVGAEFTDNDGGTWSDLNPTTTHTTQLSDLVTRDPITPTTLYMSSLRGIARSVDGGSAWTDSVAGLTGVQVSGIAQSTDKQTVYLAATAGVARSTDFTTGPTWSYPLDVTGVGDSVSAVVLPDPAAPTTVLAGTFGNGIYRSTDGGDHFTPQTITSVAFTSHNEVTGFAVGQDSRLFATHKSLDTHLGGVMVSVDGGAVWTDFGLPNSAAANAAVVLGSVVIVGAGAEFDADLSHRGIFRWDGSAWTTIAGAPVSGALVTGLVAVPPSTVYASVGDNDRGTVLRSTDGGVTWTDLRANGLPPDGWFRSLAVDPNDPSIVYAASGRPSGDAVILRTTDGGDSWSTFYQGLRDEVPNAMLVDGLMAGLNTGLFGFDAVACRLRQTNKKTFAADLALGSTAVSDLAARGISHAAADLSRVRKNGKQAGKKSTTAFGSGTSASFRVRQKGSYRATCRWQEADGSTVEAASATVKKASKGFH